MRLFELKDRPQLDKEFDRNIMPQIRKNNLQDGGFKFEKKKIKLSKLKPVQSQRVQGMHDRAMQGFQDGSIRPIIIDKNNYIVNGHHRYDVARSLDMEKVKVLKVNATVEELIDFYKHTTSDEPTIEEQFKAKLQQKLNEIKLEPNLYKNSNPKDNSYITDTYQDVTDHTNWSRIGSLPGITNSEMYDNGHTVSIFIVENKQPVFLLNIQRLADGWSTVNVVAHSQHRGKALSIPLYLAVSKHFRRPLYSFGSQSVAGNRIWEKLYQQYPNRIKAVDVITQKELDVKSVLSDDNFKTRLKLMPESVQEDVVGMNPHAKKPYFSPEEADRANDEWVNQAQVDQEDGVLVKATDGKQYRIMTSYNNEHFEDGEVYLDGLTDPTYIDTEGYPDAAELLYYHSATGHYPDDEKEIAERNLNPAVADYVKGKKTKLIKVKVADLDDEAIDDRFGRVIDVDTDVGVDLDEPILLDRDGKTILDGFHRVYQAKRIGREVIPAEIVDENFKDGKKKGKSRPGRVKRAGASCKGSVTSLRKKAKNSSGEKSKMYHWCANMKSGRKKS